MWITCAATNIWCEFHVSGNASKIFTEESVDNSILLSPAVYRPAKQERNVSPSLVHRS